MPPKENDNVEVEVKPGLMKRILPLTLILILFLGAQLAIGLIIASRLKPDDPAEKALLEQKRLDEEAVRKNTQMGSTLAAPVEVTVNIAETNGERFLVCAIQFEWDGITHPKLAAEIELRLVRIKDIIINILSSKPLVELQQRDGKKSITDAILADVNMIIPEESGTIRNCFIDKFIIQ
jgi:flagellar basal body-associated protein FliL